MKKFFYLAVIALMAIGMGTMMTACGDDDEDIIVTNKLVGKWQCTVGSEMTTTYKFIFGGDNAVSFEYRMNGSDGKLHNGYKKTGTYSVEVNEVTVVYTQHIWISTEDETTLTPEDTYETYKYTYRAENGNLVISGENDTNGGVMEDLVFTKQ